jgi:hypothetical protein
MYNIGCYYIMIYSLTWSNSNIIYVFITHITLCELYNFKLVFVWLTGPSQLLPSNSAPVLQYGSRLSDFSVSTKSCKAAYSSVVCNILAGSMLAYSAASP